MIYLKLISEKAYMNLLLWSHSENRMRLCLPFNVEKLGKCINEFQQQHEIVKKACRINITAFLKKKVTGFNSFISSQETPV